MFDGYRSGRAVERDVLEVPTIVVKRLPPEVR